MKLIIDNKIFTSFPGLNIGVVVCHGLNNTRALPKINELIAEQIKRIQTEYDVETLSQDPKIQAWRKAYAAFGGEPKKNKSSVESLYRTVLKNDDLRSINPLVDIYNFISLKYMLPVGGEDLDKISGDIHLTFADNNEPPAAMLGDQEPRSPHSGEIIYKDDVSAICRRWNWREADRTKLTEATQNCILVIEGLPPVSKEDIETATKELETLVQTTCNAVTTSHIISSDNPSISI